MMTPEVRGIYIVDVRDDAELGKYRETKHGVCVSVGEGRYMLINTHRREEYKDFMLKASDYTFLKGVDRFLSCRNPRPYKPERLIKKVGVLSETDTRVAIQKIISSRFIEKTLKAKILDELSKTF